MQEITVCVFPVFDRPITFTNPLTLCQQCVWQAFCPYNLDNPLTFWSCIFQAMKNYEQAGDYYKGEESISSANKCMLKVAQYASQQEQYEKAIEIYEQVR